MMDSFENSVHNSFQFQAYSFMLLRYLCGIDGCLHDWILIDKFVNIILKSSELNTTCIFGLAFVVTFLC